MDGVERTPSGRISRAKPPKEDPRRVGLEARQRVYRVSQDEAGSQEAGTVLGRLWLAKVITEPMKRAGEQYREIHCNAVRALDGPGGLEKSSVPGVGGDIVSDDWVDWAIRVTAVYRTMRTALDDVNAGTVVENAVLYELEPRREQEPILIAGLTRLGERMGLIKIVAEPA